MMKDNNIIRNIALLFLLLLFILQSCGKFLDEKPNPKIVTPEKLNDLSLLLDAVGELNYNVYPGLAEMNTDDFYLTQSGYNGLTDFFKDLYRFDRSSNFLLTDVNFNWRMGYKVVFYANTILEELENIQEENTRLRNEIKGKALFFRSFALSELAKVYAGNSWDEDVNSNLGIPLRLTTDFNQPTTRSSIEQTYQQIIHDLISSADLLPVETNFKTQPTKYAALALLARVYLSMGDYENAKYYADLALQDYATLMDFNDLAIDAPIPIERFNEETIFYAYSYGAAALNPIRANVDLNLYSLYADNDLRKRVFFTVKSENHIGFKGAYHGLIGNSFFNGLATDELLLIRAESRIRLNDVNEGLNDLNRLLEKRINKGEFIPYTELTKENALVLVLTERRKELLFRGLRWSDLKRLSKDPGHAINVKRQIEIDGEVRTYTLSADQLVKPFLIPDEVLIKANINQNPL